MYDHQPGLAGKAYAPTFALIVAIVLVLVICLV